MMMLKMITMIDVEVYAMKSPHLGPLMLLLLLLLLLMTRIVKLVELMSYRTCLWLMVIPKDHAVTMKRRQQLMGDGQERSTFLLVLRTILGGVNEGDSVDVDANR
jgi:hypothetical protein